ncbi:MAG: hypothetical protein FD170_2032 [Bacteroidetes bacterium]|nr:MAG: hypothetical protein FD170_2032 [Bacteroidota bacterium]
MTLRNILALTIIGLTFPLSGQVITSDTVFIQKDSLLGTSQSIYFDSNRNSKFYDRINNWDFDQYDSASYKYSIDYLKEDKPILTIRTPIIPITNWIVLKQYGGEYYVYHPCDFLFHFKVSINDSTYIDWTGEGPVGNKIIMQKKISDNKYKFKLSGINKRERVLKIHIIDSNRGIAVFTEKRGRADKNRYLMIASDKIKSVSIIVNSCIEKQNELVFDFDYIPIGFPIIEDDLHR